MTHHDETAAFAQMQARLTALLLRYEEQLFPRYYGVQSGWGQSQQADWIRPYRDLAAFYLLRDELFDHILPKIVRRLSFETPRTVEREEPPARGRIDWSRTAAATWSERPGEPPLELITRRRSRDFATPGNLLTVATLIEYRTDALRLLEDTRVAQGDEALSHPLVTIAQQCERELAFPQFAGIRHAAEQVLLESDSGLEALESEVQEHAIPGGNSAYQELIDWRVRRREIALLDRSAVNQSETLGASPARDNYLYQLWLFYEIADLLKRQDRLIEWAPGTMSLTYRWGTGEKARTYKLRHDQSIPKLWNNAPGVRPDLYIAHVDPFVVRGEKDIIWHEPGFVLDAKYYKPRDSSRAPSSPVKRMIADLRLTGERHGALLFAFQKSVAESAPSMIEELAPSEDEPEIEIHVAKPAAALYRVTPQGDTTQREATEETIAVWRVQPQIEGERSTEQALTAILDEAHTALQQRRIPRCHGIFLDALSAAQQSGLTNRWGVPIKGPASEMLLCPKPHIGPWRVDLVSRAVHCCKDPQLCHIFEQPEAQAPIRPPRSIKELVQELERVTASGGPADELGERATAIAEHVEQLTRYLATELGVFRKIDVYFHRVRDIGLGDLFEQLGPAERESLALAFFLVEQLDTIGASDYSAPAIHLSSVIEIEIKKRVFTCPNLTGDLAYHKKQTLGVLPFLRQNPYAAGDNWQRILDYVAIHWNEQIDPDDPDIRVAFDDLITRALNRISQLRNTAAHTNPLSRKDYTDLQNLVFHGGKLPCGALKAMLLAWQ